MRVPVCGAREKENEPKKREGAPWPERPKVDSDSRHQGYLLAPPV